MTAILTYPDRGRGAWNYKGVGGTISADGTAPGRWFRAPATGSNLPRIGLTGYRANRDSTECNINDYATYRAVIALQREFGETQDGIWGPQTDLKIKAWQKNHGLTADGVYGRLTARKLWTPYIERYSAEVDSTFDGLARVARGHIAWESDFDIAAVGVLTPQDLGIGQINGPAHPSLSADDRLDPRIALRWIVEFVDGNLRYFNYNVRDGVAAYNLGRGGATQWIAAGRPDVWTRTVNGKTVTTDVKKYIDSVLNAT